MEKILRELKLESLFPKFAAQRIEPENFSALSDEELSCLGVSTIGDRLRVRGLCANAGKHHPSVAANILSERMALFSGRNRKGAKRKAVTKRSWTVSFICVADPYQSRIPSSTNKQVLFHAGLGMKKIKLDLEDDEHDVKPHHIMAKPHNDKTTPHNGETTAYNDKTTSRNGETPSYNDETTSRNGETTSCNNE